MKLYMKLQFCLLSGEESSGSKKTSLCCGIERFFNWNRGPELLNLIMVWFVVSLQQRLKDFGYAVLLGEVLNCLHELREEEQEHDER